MVDAPIHFATEVNKAKKLSPYSLKVLRSVEYIESNLHKNFTLNDIASHLKQNKSYLSTQFKKEVGTTVSAYITNRKLDEAKQLLSATDLTIVEIANTLGFCNQSYFTAVFLKNNTETPLNYRRRHFRLHSNDKSHKN
jgi:YesN/AraC family two-component response regulator